MELKEIQKSIKEYYENDESKNELNFFDQYEDFFQNKNFILTTEAKNRLMLLKNLIELKINILLEGPTGTAKTLSAEIICDLLEYIKQKEKGEKYKKKETIKFNLSSETTIPDLLGRYIGSNKSLAGIKMQDGPFIDAYKNGKILILDEINLASKSLLEWIEAKQNEDLFKKKKETLRTAYKEQEDQAEQLRIQEEQQQVEDLRNNLMNAASSFNEIQLDYTDDTSDSLTVDDEDKQQMMSYILDQDADGKSQLVKDLEDPDRLIEIAWFSTQGAKALSELTKYWKGLLSEARSENKKLQAKLDKVSKNNTVVVPPSTPEPSKVGSAWDNSGLI